ncbi:MULTISPECIES: 2-keto-4-pentenoate hydratase [Pseudonocardia]|uniref:2-hydroxyhexa-2,4-dienoate hydratase n=2 Tax=Pseudonocardia TaxID=1847 RepID=A0A1Y2MJB2_PSEAH|nr:MULTISPECIES: fumarylacetoacetate hydrolase family protein [Pseudonocardia]OSY35366.1 2-hydroxyhexa-2,4-dienoate hydratase [Pseudonocardia autotrophica]TDN75468.1 2-keto-4-pentenoate hydratase [Pseudonocardia autotrophica]BBF99434.1 hydratase [Pseudonocardia autotrophica]GEC28520.1 hydratase [Pseudonocardia saturnea]
MTAHSHTDRGEVEPSAVDLVRADGTAGALWQAWTTGERLAALPELLRPRTLAEGFAAQRRLSERAGPACGWKLAATAKAGQAHIGVDAPLPGILFERFRHAPGDIVPSDGLHMAVAEAEFAFRMGAAVGAGASREELRAAVSAVHCAVELPDSRFDDFVAAGGPSLLADAACAGRFVLGPEIDGASDLDLAATPTSLQVDDDVATGTGAAVLGDPWAALGWLADTLPQYGARLDAGDLVITGTTTVPVGTRAGASVRATFGDAGALGTVEFTLAGRSD